MNHQPVQPQSPGRIIAIGDIHGCVHALDVVLEAIQPAPHDHIITLGDMIDGGRDSAAVLARLMKLAQRCRYTPVMGNHEELFLTALTNERALMTWMDLGGFATLNSYRFGARIAEVPPEDVAFIRSCVDYVETETHIFTHASYNAGLPMSEQDSHTLRWELLDHQQPPAQHCSGKTVVVGHTEQRDGNILHAGGAVCIDTYCQGYGWLTALDITTGATWQASRFGLLRQGERTKQQQAALDLLNRQAG